MRFASLIMKSSAWFLAPALMLAVMVGVAVAGYEPLSFDPTLLQRAEAAQESTATKLKTHDAQEEATGANADLPLPGTPAPAEAALTASAPKMEGLADGTFTGYAVCGQGNPDGWKPYYVAVTIQVKDGKVVRITDVRGASQADGGATLAWDAAENQAYLNWASNGRGGAAGALSQINAALSAGRSPSGIDTVSGATYSSTAIYNAYAAAVGKSAKAGGAAASASVPAASTSPQGGSTKQDSSNTQQANQKKKKTKADTGDTNAVKDKKLADGSWTGYAACGVGNDEEWSPYYVKVVIRVKNGKVIDISSVTGTSKGETGGKALNWNESENQAYLTWAADGRVRGGVQYTGVVAQLKPGLAKGNFATSVDTVSGATYSSDAIFKAFYAALRKSAKAGGATVPRPSDSDGKKPGDSTDASGDSGDSSTTDESGESGASDDSGDSGTSGDSGATDSGDSGKTDGSDDSGDSSDQGDSGQLVDGTYTAHAFCKDLDSPSAYSPYYILVDVEVAGGKIVRIANVRADSTGQVDPRYRYDSGENATYLNFAINGVGKRVKGMVAKIQEKLDAGADAASIDVDVVSSATWSSKSILEAFKKAAASVPEK